MKILITGGGTAGHVNPAISIANEFKRRNKKNIIKYVGLKKGIECEIAKKEGYEFLGIEASGIQSRKIISLIKTIFKVLLGIVQSFIIVIKEKPDIVIGTGGYVSFPLVYIAQLLGTRTYVHEQNAFPGRTNLKLFVKVNKFFVSHKDTKKIDLSLEKVVYSGNPIKKEFTTMDREKSRKKLECKDEVLNVISLGGSGGARKVNDLMLEIIKSFSGNENVRITHITGRSYYERFKKIMLSENLKFEKNIEILPYTYELPYYFNAYDLVISRAGAGAISELEACGIPAIIIPSPNVKDNHQEFNANSLKEKGSAIVILEKDMVYVNIINMIKNFSIDRTSINKYKSAKIEDVNAAKVIVDTILNDR